jgi:hypothetical protein
MEKPFLRFVVPVIVLLIIWLVMCKIFGIGCIGGGGNPDYRVKFISAPPTGTRGQIINVTICTTNAANLDKALSNSETRWYINTAATISGATDLGHCTVLPLVAKGYTNWVTTGTVPANQPTGQNFLIAVCDFLKNVTESNENNNTNTPSQSITIN